MICWLFPYYSILSGTPGFLLQSLTPGGEIGVLRTYSVFCFAPMRKPLLTLDAGMGYLRGWDIQQPLFPIQEIW